MLVKYYLSDNIKVRFENFALGLQKAWASPSVTLSFFLVFWPIGLGPI